MPPTTVHDHGGLETDIGQPLREHFQGLVHVDAGDRMPETVMHTPSESEVPLRFSGQVELIRRCKDGGIATCGMETQRQGFARLEVFATNFDRLGGQANDAGGDRPQSHALVHGGADEILVGCDRFPSVRFNQHTNARRAIPRSTPAPRRVPNGSVAKRASSVSTYANSEWLFEIMSPLQS
jgi:hypothetical protein